DRQGDVPLIAKFSLVSKGILQVRRCPQQVTLPEGGNSDLLLALVKNAEDRLNIDFDTRRAKVRVLILVEDSPVYYSSFLPLIYKEVVTQTQAVLELGLNEEHRLLTMRARPKILLAENYEEALELYHRYQSYLFGIISDARIPRGNSLDGEAGVLLLSQIRKEIPDLPLLLMSSESKNREKAEKIPAVFLDKNSSNLLGELHDFFMNHLGFGDFVFRLPDGKMVDRASNIRELTEKVSIIPDESLWHHANRNHFSNWLMARSEITLASTFREVQASEFCDAREMRQYIISHLVALRKWRQKGLVAQFRVTSFDPEVNDFVKIGQGSMGGKARGLAFMSALLQEDPKIPQTYPDINIGIPRTLVICTDGFESFVSRNRLEHYAKQDYADQDVAEGFLKAEMPGWLTKDLEAYLSQVRYPLSVRSSSLLEDAQFQPYAGLYRTYMIPNNHPDLSVRLKQLITAIKLVYASTYGEGAKAFSKSIANQPQLEAMAVIIQQLAGDSYGDYFYPALSGVAQSHNFYPVSPMNAEDGIALVALGLGKTVVEGERALRFSPKYPQILPQFSTVDDILTNAQRFFYVLRTKDYPEGLNFGVHCNLEKRELDDAENEFPVRVLSSTYVQEEHRIRDVGAASGYKVLTFAQVLKQNLFPLPQILTDFLELGRKGMGCPIEIEFSVNLSPTRDRKSDFFFLQIRPMVADDLRLHVEITARDRERAFCRSTQALGNGRDEEIADIVYLKPDDFEVKATLQMVEEIDGINGALQKEKRPYLLIGPGRWGSADRWLGIPVQWKNISGVRAMVELRNDKVKADPSQGSHFFQNITSLGIHYIPVTEEADSEDYIDWEWLNAQPVVRETTYVRHARLKSPLMLKIDGRTSESIMVATS
ncbi:MAG: phosphoenolpyruvate synthase/pyruvate phosphate dikinase, partial [Desulfobacterales bacterium]|nr:phosphoenolpyruvate synthase/pyruvate phosphate dikinase [Desulfobacterales bacterium]